MRLVSAAILSMVVSGCAFGQTYTISTFAGGGLPVNIPGTQAGLRSVGSVAVDRAGNVLFTDPYNHIVLRLDGTTGGVSLVAGNGTPGYSGDNGPATSAQLLLPVGIAVDSAGNLYIADTGDSRVRKVSNGVITTVAGNGTVRLQRRQRPGHQRPVAPSCGVAVDAAGNLYIADTVTTASARSRTG